MHTAFVFDSRFCFRFIILLSVAANVQSKNAVIVIINFMVVILNYFAPYNSLK